MGRRRWLRWGFWRLRRLRTRFRRSRLRSGLSFLGRFRFWISLLRGFRFWISLHRRIRIRRLWWIRPGRIWWLLRKKEVTTITSLLRKVPVLYQDNGSDPVRYFYFLL
ncbi:hypothetical protein RvY_12512-2 [Ramazzottius varieornatus]|uniref:Uncharacterized protein n=1 Tax=Ramazzottius varieornatus TaxID=947166 RepID=A0A1D1VJR5_RAMVA|nr:hypothetical protein RvY_12512-2 [Ramazzottius varieornatus]